MSTLSMPPTQQGVFQWITVTNRISFLKSILEHEKTKAVTLNRDFLKMKKISILRFDLDMKSNLELTFPESKISGNVS